MQGKGLEELKALKAESGLSYKVLAGLLKTPYDTVLGWTCGKAKPADGLLSLAVQQVRAYLAAKLVKQKVSEKPHCAYCGEELILSEVKRGYFTVSHRCRSGWEGRLPPRPKEEALYALTQIVSVGTELAPRPMNTAPKDGTRILLFPPEQGEEAQVVFWDGRWAYADIQLQINWEPVGWCPVPVTGGAK